MGQGNGRARVDVEAVKAAVDLVAFFKDEGVVFEPGGNGNLKARCPMHDDRDASLVVTPARGLWHCMGACQRGGDVLDWLRIRHQLSFPNALARLMERAGTPVALPPPVVSPPEVRPGELPGRLSRAELLNQVASFYAGRLRATREGRDYLTARGLDDAELWDAFKIGYADGALLSRLPQDAATQEALRQIGVINAQGKEHFYGCIVVPLEHPDAGPGVVGLYGRRILPHARVPHLYLPGPRRGVLNWPALKLSRRILIAESVLDALSLWRAGLHDVTCLYGAGGMHPDLAELLTRYAVEEVCLCLDADAAGREGTARLAQGLSSSGIRLLAVTLPAKDPNHLLVEQGPAALRDAMAAPVAMTPEVSPAIAEDASEDGFVLRCGALSYRVTPIGPFGACLKVRYRASEGDKTHVDRLDLYVHRVRMQSAAQLARRMGIAREEAEAHMAQLLAAAERWVEAHVRKP